MTKIDLLINLLQKILKQVSMPSVPLGQILDSTDVKEMLKIGDSKLYRLKKKGILRAYDMDGKDMYLKQEVLEALLSRPKPPH